MEEILKLLKDYESKNEYTCRLYFYTDGSGGVIDHRSIIVNRIIFQFKDIEHLKSKLSE